MTVLAMKIFSLSKSTIASFRTAIYTAFALIAFAANSILCRLALSESSIDPASFTTIRLASGAMLISLIAGITSKERDVKHPGNWISASMLFLYATAFSYAYVSLSAGSGALILFGSVQVTMILTGLWKGERPRIPEWCGLFIALSGLVYLVMPGLEAPPLLGAFLMTVAGISWGVYTLRGRSVDNPVAVTGDNFLRSVPPMIAISLFLIPSLDISMKGVILAFLSGAVTSGMGYVIWYAVLGDLSATRAAMVQLLVPVIAALGGVLFLSELITPRLILSAILIIGGVGSCLFVRE